MQVAHSIPKNIQEDIAQLSDDDKMALVFVLLQNIHDSNFSEDILKDEDIKSLISSQASFSWLALKKTINYITES